MKTWKLVSGILSTVLFVFVTFQSCAAGLSNTFSNSGEVSGSAGIIVALMLVAGGVVSIATRNISSIGANIAIAILYGIGTLLGFSLAGSFTDLYIWATWCFVCAVMGIIAIAKS